MRKEAVSRALRLSFAGVIFLVLVLLIWLMAMTLLTLKDKGVPVLIYHNFSWSNNVSGNNKMLTERNAFIGQMDYLYNNGYQVIPLQSLLKYMSTGEPVPEKAVVITIDDGYESNYTLAFPILKQYNFPATIFLIAGKVGSNRPDEPAMLSWMEMREMEQSGLVDIQAHSFDLHHKVYENREQTLQGPAVVTRAYLPDRGRRETATEYNDKLYQDFIQARTVIESNLHKQVDTMAWPSGAYNLTALRLAREAGFKYLVTIRTGMNQRGDNVQAVRRINVDGQISPAGFAELLEPDRSYIRQFRHVAFRYFHHLVEVFL